MTGCLVHTGKEGKGAPLLDLFLERTTHDDPEGVKDPYYASRGSRENLLEGGSAHTAFSCGRVSLAVPEGREGKKAPLREEGGGKKKKPLFGTL